MAVADMLDAGSPPRDPRQCAADVAAAGARVVGLYAVNLSDPQTVVSAEYARAVAAAGAQVLPIITPGEAPPAASSLVAMLAGWEGLNAGGLCGVDIEQPGIDTPYDWWVSDLLNALSLAGWGMLEYTNLRGLYPYGLWWAVDWDHGSAAPIPPAAAGVQFSPAWRGPSGSEYDPSWLLPSIMPSDPAPAPAPAVRPSLRRRSDDVFVMSYNGQEHLFYVDPSGQLWHYYQGPGGNPSGPSWSSEQIPGAGGLIYPGLLWGDPSFDNQAHVWAEIQGGGVLHAFQESVPSISYAWGVEKIGAPAPAGAG